MKLPYLDTSNVETPAREVLLKVVWDLLVSKGFNLEPLKLLTFLNQDI